MTADKPSHLVPRLRFPEFREGKGWARVPLNSVLSEDKIKSDGQTEVHSVSLTKGVVSQVEHMGRSFSAADTSHYSLVRPFDVVYTKSPLAIFKLGIVKQHRGPHNALVSPLYGAFTPANRHIGQLIEAYFDSPSRSLRFLDPLAQKGAKNTIQISNEKFLSGELFLPSDEREQQKIADCLGSLDDLIAAEGRKLEALHRHKQGLMQQLFPQPGEIVPRLRFPEFEGAADWEQKRLSSLVKLVSGVHLAPNMYSSTGEVPYFTGPSDFTDAIQCVAKWTAESVNIAKQHDTLITVKGSGVGEIWYLTLPSIAMGRQLMAVRTEVGDRRFIYQFLSTKRAQFEGLASGNLIPGLSRGDILGMAAYFPSRGEQQKIADCLGLLDDLMAAEGRKLDALRQHKQGLIQQLFPSLEGH